MDNSLGLFSTEASGFQSFEPTGESYSTADPGTKHFPKASLAMTASGCHSFVNVRSGIERDYPWLDDPQSRDSFTRTSFDQSFDQLNDFRVKQTSSVNSASKCPRGLGKVPSGALNPMRLDTCPKCFRATLRKIANYFGANPPVGDQMEVLGASPADFERIHGRQCTWTLFKWACPCSEPMQWWWSYLLHSESIEGKCFPVSRNPSPAIECTGLVQQSTSPQVPYGYAGNHMIATSKTPGPTQLGHDQTFANSFSLSYNSFDSSRDDYTPATSVEEDLVADADSPWVSSSCLNSPRVYPSPSDQGSTAVQARSQRAVPRARSTETTQVVQTPARRRPHPRVIKDRWKYAFHHRFGACQSCRASRCQCSPEHLGDDVLRKVPLSCWLERPFPGWRPTWVPPAMPPTGETHER